MAVAWTSAIIAPAPTPALSAKPTTSSSTVPAPEIAPSYQDATNVTLPSLHNVSIAKSHTTSPIKSVFPDAEMVWWQVRRAVMMGILSVVTDARLIVLSNTNIIIAKILLITRESPHLKGPCVHAAFLTVGIAPLISIIVQLARQGMLVGTFMGLTVAPLSVLVTIIAISVIPKVVRLALQGT